LRGKWREDMCVMFGRQGALGTRQFCICQIVRLARRSDTVALGRVWDKK
jgi:hypothetical protein